MGLKVWLPLNNDFRNLGTAGDAVISTSGTLSDASTMIGGLKAKSSASFTLKRNYLGKVGSVCFWVYVNSNDTRANYFGNNGMDASTTNRKWTLHAYPTRNDLHSWGCMKDNSSNANGMFVLTGVIPDDTWTHVAWCHDTSNQYIYINGVLKGTYTWDSSGPFTWTNSFPVYGYDEGGRYMNDFRIYDHCLSVKEVKDLAKAMVCHYKLDSIGGRTGNPNMLGYSYYPDSMYMTFGATTAYTTEMIDCGGGIYSRKFTVNADPTSWHFTGISTKSFYPRELKANSKYTFSFWLKTDKQRSFTIRIMNDTATGQLSSNSINLTTIGDSQWHKYSGTWTTVADVSIASGQIIYFYGLEFSGTYEFKLLKLEEGDTATDWVPRADKDTMYAALGYNNIITDMSGHGNDATVVNAPGMTTNSSAYDSAIQISSISNKILTPKLLRSGNNRNNYTIAWWEYFNGTAFSTNMPWGYSDGNRLNPCHYSNINNIICNTGDSTNNPFSPAITASMISNGWHHMAMVGNGSNVRFFIDGIYKSTSTTFKGITGTQLYINGWDSSTNYSMPVGSRLNDFRLYYTALSDADIKELASVKTWIDDKGTLGSYKFDETLSGINIKKSGIVSCNRFCEIPVYFDSNIYIEPDGSKWVRIFHHNNPTLYKFASTNPWTTPFYIDENRWWNICLLSNPSLVFPNYELMVKQKPIAGMAETIYRWAQPTNPMTGDFNSTVYTNINTNFDTSRYKKPKGGIYTHNSNARIVMNNGSNGSWFGAIGCWTAWEGGIPGFYEYGVTSGVPVSTGYIDLFIRVESVTTTSDVCSKTEIHKSDNINSRKIIEI